MPVITYCPPTCLITRVVVTNSYNLEYTLIYNDQPIIPRTVIINGTNIWFSDIIPYNVSTHEVNLYLKFHSQIQQIVEVDTTIISFNPSYYFTLLYSNTTFTDSGLNITCTLNNGNLTLTPITSLSPTTITNALNKMYFASGKRLHNKLSCINELGLFEFRYFKTLFVTVQDPYFVGTLVIDPQIDFIKNLFIQINDIEILNIGINVSYQPCANVVTYISKVSGYLKFENDAYLNLNTYNSYQITIFSANSMPIQNFLEQLEDIKIYAEGGFVTPEIKANNLSNVFITL